MNWGNAESSQLDVSGEKMPCVLVVGDISVGVSRKAESSDASSNAKADCFRSSWFTVDEGRWKSMMC